MLSWFTTIFSWSKLISASFAKYYLLLEIGLLGSVSKNGFSIVVSFL